MHDHHNSPTLQVLESHLTMERVGAPEGGPRWIAVTLSFDPADPWALTLALFAGPVPVRWTFGRELLVEGLHEPTGEGDVRVRPQLDEAGRAVVEVELTSPDGALVGQLPSREVTWFVHGVLDSVPLGQETAHLDLDSLVDGLVHPDR